MTRDVLSDRDRSAAEGLLVCLEANRFPVTTAVWRYDEDSREWLLHLETPLAERDPRAELYVRLESIRQENGIPLRPGRVVLWAPRHPSAGPFRT